MTTHAETVHSDHVTIYRGYTVTSVSPVLVLIHAIGDDPVTDTSISTTWSVTEAMSIIDNWVIGSVR